MEERFARMASLRPVSLAQVARAAGVSPSTASLALRNDDRVRPETITAVRAAAAKLGYKSDARVASLMARIRQARPLRDRERLAFIWVSTPQDQIAGRTKSLMSFLQSMWAGASQRADELGCRLEEFSLNAPGMNPSRLEKILRTRGITGVIFSAPIQAMEVTIDWNWEHFAAAVIGNSKWSPALHRAGHHHYRSTLIALNWLREQGSRRPGVILHEAHHRRIHGVHQAAFLINHPEPAAARELCLFDREVEPGRFRQWCEATRPDSLITVTGHLAEPIRKIADELSVTRYVSLSCNSEMGGPGIDLRTDLIAASAVDLVVAQLHRNERGVPAHPVTLLLEGEWVEG